MNMATVVSHRALTATTTTADISHQVIGQLSASNTTMLDNTIFTTDNNILPTDNNILSMLVYTALGIASLALLMSSVLTILWMTRRTRNIPERPTSSHFYNGIQPSNQSVQFLRPYTQHSSAMFGVYEDLATMSFIAENSNNASDTDRVGYETPLVILRQRGIPQIEENTTSAISPYENDPTLREDSGAVNSTQSNGYMRYNP